MLRNIPNKLSQAQLKEIVDESSGCKYDFMYLRIVSNLLLPDPHIHLPPPMRLNLSNLLITDSRSGLLK